MMFFSIKKAPLFLILALLTASLSAEPAIAPCDSLAHENDAKSTHFNAVFEAASALEAAAILTAAIASSIEQAAVAIEHAAAAVEQAAIGAEHTAIEIEQAAEMFKDAQTAPKE